MTLREWLAAHPTTHYRYVPNSSGPVSVRVFPSVGTNAGDLYRLTDYLVSSALSGPSYLLVPKLGGWK